MPSWKVHRKWGEILFKYYNHEIDKLIDIRESHDAGRYDPETLDRQLRYVANQYGDNGVWYYLLHHFLDRAYDTLLSEVSTGLGYIFLKYQGRRPSKSLCFSRYETDLSPKEFAGRLCKNFLNALRRDLSVLLKVAPEETEFFFDYFKDELAICALLFSILNDRDFINKLWRALTPKEVAKAFKFGEGIEDVFKKQEKLASEIANYIKGVVEELAKRVEKAQKGNATIVK